MTLGFKARAMLAGLAKHGEPSSLAGVDCGHVAIERGVDVFAGIGDTAHDNHTVKRDVATMAAAPAGVDWLLKLDEGTTAGGYNPKTGQTLVHPSGTFVLDRKVADNGFTRRFIIVASA